MNFSGKVVCSLVALSGVLLVAGCGKKKAGAACTGTEAVCTDKQTILECHGDKMVQMSCKGPKGCSETATGAKRTGRTVTTNVAVSCDFSGNAPGEECVEEDEAVCSADKTKMITCKGKKLVFENCRGDKHCSETPTEIKCDTSVQAVGDACEGKEFACTTDKKQSLACKDGKMAVDGNCRGAKGCYVDGDAIACDLGNQQIAEPCGTGGGYACSTDTKALLKCASGKWALDQKCKKACFAKGASVGCS